MEKIQTVKTKSWSSPSENWNEDSFIGLIIVDITLAPVWIWISASSLDPHDSHFKLPAELIVWQICFQSAVFGVIARLHLAEHDWNVNSNLIHCASCTNSFYISFIFDSSWTIQRDMKLKCSQSWLLIANMLRSGRKLQVFMWKLWHKDEGIHVFSNFFLSEMMTLTTATEMSSLLSLQMNMTLSLNQEISISFSLVMNRSSAVVTVLDLSAHFASSIWKCCWSWSWIRETRRTARVKWARLNARVKWSHNRFFSLSSFYPHFAMYRFCIHSRKNFTPILIN